MKMARGHATCRAIFQALYFLKLLNLYFPQERVELRNVTGMNITLSDRVDGPFCLEIQGRNSLDI